VGAVLSGPEGTFTFPPRAAGIYFLEVASLGYGSTERQPIELIAGETLSLRIELLPDPILLDPIVASSARALYNRGTIAGALARRGILPAVGGRRVVIESDVEMWGAVDVSGILRWFPPPSGCRALTSVSRAGQVRTCGCIIVQWIGHPVQQLELADWYLSLSPRTLAAVEYYRNWIDAPADLKGFPMYVDDPYPCAVVALWPQVGE
jgi:hypothetical protein